MIILLSETVIADRQIKGVAIRSFIIFIKSSAEDRDKLPTIWRNNDIITTAARHTPSPPYCTKSASEQQQRILSSTAHSKLHRLLKSLYSMILCYSIVKYILHFYILYDAKRKSITEGENVRSAYTLFI